MRVTNPISALLPQDLSFQSDVRILRPPPPFQHRRPRRYKACLPPIDTFSHNRPECAGLCIRKGRTRKPTQRFFCEWPGCKFALNRIPFKYLCLLKRHTVWHREPEPVRCPECGMTFHRKVNLERHRLIHKGRKPYVCEVCKRAYSRTSERSRCRKHHKLVSEIPTPTPVSTVVGLTALEVETAIDRARPRPYKCSICGDKRAYTDSGSLRKHMRRYHPGDRASEVKRSGVSGSQAKNGSTSQPACLAASSDNTAQLTNSYLMMQSNPPESDTKLIHFSTATPSNYTSHSAPTVVPISLYDPVGTSHEVFLNTTHPNLYALYVVDQPDMPPAASEVQFESTHQTVPYVGAANTEGAPPVNSPMNLCNSDVCATAAVNEVCDLSTNLDLSSHPEARMLSGFGAPSSTSLDVLGCFTVNGETFHGQEDALDLTESQYFTASGSNETAIDLSGDASFGFSLSLNPVDLSAPHQNYPQLLYEQDTTLLCATSEQNRAQNSLLNWDPEPGFSFTDLLTNTDLEETDTVFNISASVGQEVPLNYSPAKPVLPLSGVPPPLDLRLFHS
ncbi:zinc finger, C2H2 type [Opisthorchis viverrini]|uniref:Zinc finger, C2H2 type n=1 Tax=Opisthorchis viverrini TaxID=6198 RepID=A0A1S8WS35_OPIVI|nr:zinc finger, C2H2 type [Opisthorchis viverrini]